MHEIDIHIHETRQNVLVVTKALANGGDCIGGTRQNVVVLTKALTDCGYCIAFAGNRMSQNMMVLRKALAYCGHCIAFTGKETNDWQYTRTFCLNVAA